MPFRLLAAAVAVLALAAPAFAQNVKITPLGSHAGELCANDRATLFEDPTGVRLLYDVGHTLTGADDPRHAQRRDAAHDRRRQGCRLRHW